MSDLHKSKGLEAKRQEPLKRKKGFELQSLPGLARSEVIRSMDINEIIKLSLCSRKMEGMIRRTEVKSNKIGIHVNVNNPRYSPTLKLTVLEIEFLNKKLYQFEPDQLIKGSKNLRSQILSRLVDKYPTPFQNCLSIFKHLQNIISFKSRYMDVDLEGMTLRSLKEILTEPAIRNFDLLRLDKGEIDAECLDLVMEMANSNIDLHIMSGTKIPFNYHHENAFKFRDSFYSDARQYRLEHLLRLKDAYSVRLGMHRLTHYDVNTFIKFWIKSDHDMVDLLGLDMREFRPEILFDGIVVLIGQRMGHACFYLIAANPTKRRECQIMSILWLGNKIHLYSWEKDQSFKIGNTAVESWAPEYEVLMVMNKKKELERELERIQNSYEADRDQNMVEKKNEITRDLQNVSQELDSLNLVFENGFYHYKQTNIPR